jgi:hypothetical protein
VGEVGSVLKWASGEGQEHPMPGLSHLLSAAASVTCGVWHHHMASPGYRTRLPLLVCLQAFSRALFYNVRGPDVSK